VEHLRERLLSGAALLAVLAWLGCAVVIAVWVTEVTDLEVRRRGAVNLVLLIFLVPIGVAVALDELVVRRIRFGRPAPGRHRRGDLDPDRLRTETEF
jgi:hypothetical protein